MKNFFTSLFGSLLGSLLAIILVLFIVAGLIGSFFSGIMKLESKTKTPLSASVLCLKLDKKIPERTSKSPFDNFSFGSLSTEIPIGLNDILAELKEAKGDDHVKGIFLELSSVPAGSAMLEEIRNALLDFKKSKKFIISYGETYTQGAYYIASVSDKVYLHPAGLIEWKGLSAQIMFYKGLLDKLDVSVQIFRHGKFKSAIEPFDLDKMSEANRLQTLGYVSAIWNHLCEGVAAERNISIGELNRLADGLLVHSASDALVNKLADELLYKDEVLDRINKLLKNKENEKINFVTIEAYRQAPKKIESGEGGRKKIAVIYAVGEIQSGEGDDSNIGSERISKAIRDARLDASIKAIVLRVNSPGGSALASDVIWREVTLAKAAKPVVVSMGDVAASGGYYIACAADRIFAQPNTITGSIGVFGILPNVQKLLNNKLGITIDTVKTNRHSDLGSLYRPVTPEERIYILNGIQQVYAEFITKVGAGRHLDTARVDSIGQGRVWSGTDGKAIGLVDELGGINEAIACAAKMAKLEQYKIISLPVQKSALSALFSDLTTEEQTNMLKTVMGESYLHYLQLKSLTQAKGVQARIPYDVFFN
ncbi:MAG: signal peptide peptidase SppA [Bacteroidia bacterium]